MDLDAGEAKAVTVDTVRPQQPVSLVQKNAVVDFHRQLDVAAMAGAEGDV